MMPLPHDALPLATTSPFTPWARSAAVQAADWSRALERARDQVSAERLSPSRSPDVQVPAMRANTAARGVPAQVTHAVPGGNPCAELASGLRDISHAAACCFGPATLMGVTEEVQAPPEVSSSRARVCAPRPHAERQPLRVHVDHGSEGLAVWVGWDGPARSAPLAAILSALGQHRAGIPVASLVCNGSVLYARTHRKENA